MRSSSRNYYEGKNIERSRNRSTPKDKPSDSGRDSGKEAKTAKDEEKQRKKKNYSSSSSNISEHERRPACYVCEPTGWTVPDSETTDPVYVCESDSSSFVPLPQAQIDKRPTTDPRIEEHFIGVRTCDEAGAIVKPDDFVLYYRKDDDNELDVTIPLCLAHRNTRNKVRGPCNAHGSGPALQTHRAFHPSGVGKLVPDLSGRTSAPLNRSLFHFPVVRYTEVNGSKWWYVQTGNHRTRSVHLPQIN